MLLPLLYHRVSHYYSFYHFFLSLIAAIVEIDILVRPILSVGFKAIGLGCSTFVLAFFPP